MKNKICFLSLFLIFILFDQVAQASEVSSTVNQQDKVGNINVIADINFRDPSIIKQENNKLIL
ncbi:MAG: hypothetical protein WCK16_04905 [Candidatus Moraniibacteriota bacterium]